VKRLAQIITASLLMLSTSAVVLAQDVPTSTIGSGGVSFAFPSSLGPNVNVVQYPGDDPSLEQPGGPLPPSLEFQIYTTTDQPVDTLRWDAQGYVTVYSTADFAEYPFYQDQHDALQSLLQAQTPLEDFLSYNSAQAGPELPFVPVYPAAQVIRAQARYVDTGVLQGVSYLTVYRQDASPFRASEFVYTFQGLSADGSLYVSVRLPVTAPGIPEEYPADFDYEAWGASIDQYMNDTIAMLNAASPADFTPALTTLDDIVSTITLDAIG
jgi:hypothetical protein